MPLRYRQEPREMAAGPCLNKRRVRTVRTLCITVFCRIFSIPTTARAGTLLLACPISREIKTLMSVPAPLMMRNSNGYADTRDP
jgi:hypothetical protein